MTKPTLARERAAAIAAALPGTWEIGEGRWRGHNLKRSDGLTIYLTTGWNGSADRLLISGELPPARGAYLYDCPRKEITCTIRKTDAQVARDIELRLLPAAQESHDNALKQIARHESYQLKLLALKKRIGHLFGQGEDFAEATREFGDIGFHARVTTPTSVELDLRLDDPDEAVCVIRAIQAARATWRKVNGEAA